MIYVAEDVFVLFQLPLPQFTKLYLRNLIYFQRNQIKIIYFIADIDDDL